MATLRVASRYAKSLLQQALEKGILDSVHTDMLLFEQLCKEHKALERVLRSPIINHDKKLAILQALFEGRVNELMLGFFNLISYKGREAILPDIIQAFLKQYNHYKGIKAASVTVTFPLPADLVDRFKALVRSIISCKEVTLTQHINPAILGGYILQVEDKKLDESLVTKLYSLKKYCVASGY